MLREVVQRSPIQKEVNDYVQTKRFSKYLQITSPRYNTHICTLIYTFNYVNIKYYSITIVLNTIVNISGNS